MTKEYQYRATTSDGKIRQGKILADNEKMAVNKIYTQGLIPLSVSLPDSPEDTIKTPILSRSPGETGLTKRFSGLLNLRISLGRTVKTKDLIKFSENLSTMLKAGITLNKSLIILKDLTENRSFVKVIDDVHNQIREGSSLHQALEKHPSVFPPVFANMVRAGESGGILDLVLKRVAEFLREIQELKDYLVSSMIYPVILGMTAFVSILIMLTVVVPKFAVIFSDMGVELPLVTRIMLSAGNFLQHNWWLLALGIAFCVLSFKYFVSTPGGRDRWDQFKLKIPMVGPILLKVEIARFSKTLGTLLNSGVSILAAMNILKGVVVNTALKKSLDQVYNDLKQGRMLSTSLERHQVFPALAVNMLGVGEESGNMPEMLEKVGDMYDKDLKASIKAFTALFEPMVILVMGLVIGVMVVSMLLAIFSLNELGV